MRMIEPSIPLLICCHCVAFCRWVTRTALSQHSRRRESFGTWQSRKASAELSIFPDVAAIGLTLPRGKVPSPRHPRLQLWIMRCIPVIKLLDALYHALHLLVNRLFAFLTYFIWNSNQSKTRTDLPCSFKSQLLFDFRQRSSLSLIAALDQQLQ